MSVNLGTAFAALRLDSTGFKTGLAESKAGLNTFYDQTALASKSLTSFGDTATKVGKGMTVGLTAPIVAASALAVKLSNSFETGMAKVSTIADTTKVPLKDLQNGLIEMSNKVGMSSDSLSEAMYQAISASVKTEDALGFVGNAAKLAKAGFTQTATAVDLLTTIMNSYGMSADKVTHISDVLVTTQNLGKTTVDELAHSMGMVIPTAKASGVSLENLSAAYEIITSKGVNTAESTTYIKAMLAELGKEGTTVDKVLRGETGMGFTDLMGKGKSLGDVLAILNDYANKNGTSIKNLFGSIEAGGAAFTLADSGATDFNAKLSDLVGTTGDVDSAFKIMENTTEEKWNKTLERGKNLLIQYGEALKKSLVPMLEKAENVAQNLYTWFTGLSIQQQQLLIKVLAVTAAVGPLLIFIGKISTGVAAIINVVSKISPAVAGAEAGSKGLLASLGAIGTTVAPILAVIAVIGALVALFKALYDNNDQFRAQVNIIWSDVQTAFQGMAETVGSFLASLQNALAPAFDILKESVGTFVDGAGQAFASLQTGFSTIWTAISPILSALWSSLQPLVEFLGITLVGSISLLIGVVNGVINAIQPLIAAIGSIMQVIGGVIELIEGFFTGDADMIYQGLNDIGAGILGFVANIWAAISGFFAGLWNGATSALGGLLGMVGISLNSILSNVTNFVLSVVSWIANIPARILGFFLSIPEQLAKIDLSKAGRDIINSLWNGLKSAWDAVAGWFSGIANTIGGFFKGIGDAVGHVVKSVKGSHAGGLSYVPYNGYVAELHEGEKVLTRNQAEQYDKGGTGSGYTFIFNSPKELDPYEADKVMKKTYREMEAGLI